MDAKASPGHPRSHFRRTVVAVVAALASVILLQFAAFAPGSAATTTVKVGQSPSGTAAQRFNAAAITITAGDTVRWEWFNGAHDVHGYNYPSLSSGPKGGINSAGETYSFTFSTAGTYTYYCDEHAGPGDADPANIDANIASGNKMVGKVTVLPAGSPSGLSLLTAAVSFAPVVITGVSQDVDAQPVTWRASDATGSGSGWRITISGGELSAGSSTIPASNLKVRLLQNRITTVSGNTAPQSLVTSYQSLSQASATTLVRAATGTGMGTYDLAPEFRLTVPANVKEGTYTASLVVTIVSGP
ncbi:MAG: WxL domain-containing protein [Chloroflexi bacterium]|nr:WxL domain-containing protein [Chloroflexota bacterium]